MDGLENELNYRSAHKMVANMNASVQCFYLDTHPLN